MKIKTISRTDIPSITWMALNLWPDCEYEEEFANFIRITGSPDEHVFVAKEDDVCAGFIYLALRRDYVEGTTSSPVAYIEAIYVEPGYRKRGTAKLLVEKGEKWAIENNCSEMASDTALNNIDGIGFHVSLGFREVNRIVCFTKQLINQ